MHFGTRIDVIIAMEMGNKLDSETAYQLIKSELKKLKKVRKQVVKPAAEVDVPKADF